MLSSYAYTVRACVRYGDGFQNGGPDGEDPLLLARQMASQGISLVRIGPAHSTMQSLISSRLHPPSSLWRVNRRAQGTSLQRVSDELAACTVDRRADGICLGFGYGLWLRKDFFRALTVITSAVLVPLTTASLLSHVIVGSALEQMDMDRIIQEVGFAVGERVHGGGGDVDDIARELQEKLMLRGEATKQLTFESIHVSGVTHVHA